MSNKALRNTFRWFHIVGSIIIGTYIYSPYTSNEAFTLIVQVGVIPLLGVTGVLMWQQAKVSKFLRRFRKEDQAASAA